MYMYIKCTIHVQLHLLGVDPGGAFAPLFYSLIKFIATGRRHYNNHYFSDKYLKGVT